MSVSLNIKKQTSELQKIHVEEITHYELMGETFLGQFQGVLSASYRPASTQIMITI